MTSNIASAKKHGVETNKIMTDAAAYNRDTHKKTILLAGCIVFFVLILILLIGAGSKKRVTPAQPDNGNSLPPNNIPSPVRMLAEMLFFDMDNWVYYLKKKKRIT